MLVKGVSMVSCTSSSTIMTAYYGVNLIKLEARKLKSELTCSVNIPLEKAWLELPVFSVEAETEVRPFSAA